MTKKNNAHNFVKGAVVGAALMGAGALAAAAAMSNEDTRNKFKDEAKKFGDKSADFLKQAYEDASVQLEELRKKIEKWIDEGKKSEEYKQMLENIDKFTDKLNDAKQDGGKDLERVVGEVKKSVEELKEELEDMAEAA